MICIECVTPEPLKKLFDTHGQEGDCQYCQRHGKAIESRVLLSTSMTVSERTLRKGMTFRISSWACSMSAGPTKLPWQALMRF